MPKEKEEYAPLPYIQQTDPQTGMWIRQYVYDTTLDNAAVKHVLREHLNVRKEQLNVPTWREYYSWRLQ